MASEPYCSSWLPALPRAISGIPSLLRRDLYGRRMRAFVSGAIDRRDRVTVLLANLHRVVAEIRHIDRPRDSLRRAASGRAIELIPRQIVFRVGLPRQL